MHTSEKCFAGPRRAGIRTIHRYHWRLHGCSRHRPTQLEDLPPRKLAYIQGRLDGKSKKQAALDAGFSENMAKHAADKIETKDVREAFARLVREMVPPQLIAKDHR